MKKISFLLLSLTIIVSQSLLAQLNIKVKVLGVAVVSNANCDGAGSSDFLFEFKATDNSSLALSNNTPVVGSIGNCNFVSVTNNNGPFTLTPSAPGLAVFSPTNGIFFDRNYNCKKDIPTVLTLVWRGYENDDVTSPSSTPVANGASAIQTNTFAIPTSNGTYTTQYTAASADGGCPQTYQIAFSIIKSVGAFSPLQIIDIEAPAICTGANNGTLTANVIGGSGIVLYDWSNDGLGDYNDPMNLAGLSAGTFTFVVKDALNCTDTLVSLVSEINAPAPLGTFITSSSVVCTGQTNVLYAVNSQSVNYNWSYSSIGAAISGSSSSVTINYLNFATSGVLSVYAQNSCSVTPTLTMNITVNSTPSIIISGNNAVCNNGQEMLSASGASSYTWNTGVNTSSIIVTPTATTIYTVIGTTNGCAAQQQFTMSVLASPTVQASGTTATLCPNQTATLTATGNGNLFIWSDGFIGANHTVTVTATTVFTITNTFTNSCFGQNTFTVNVYNTPTISLTSNTTICKGTSATLSVSGANSYTWSTGVNTNSIVVTPTVLTQYTVLGTNTVTTCSNTKTVTVNIYTATPIAITGNTTICSGTTNIYTASGSLFYLWNNGATAASNTVITQAPITLSVVATTINGCKDTAYLAINVKPTPTLTLVGTDTICQGQTATITANAISAVTYSWSNGSTSTGLNVMPNVTTNYTLTVLNNNCSAMASHQVNVKATPTINLAFPLLCNNNPVYTLTATPTGGVFSGIGVNGNNFDPLIGSGSYFITYSVTAANGCGASLSDSLKVTTCIGIEEINTEAQLKVYPNPASHIITIASQKEIMQLSIYNLEGSLLKTIAKSGYEQTVTIEDLPAGFYTIKVKLIDSTIAHIKIIKE